MSNNSTSKVKKKAEFAAFIPGALDDFGLSAAQFRIFCRISRRGRCDEAVPNMARTCRLSQNTVWSALAFLRDAGMIRRTSRQGNTTIFEVNSPSAWQRYLPKQDARNRPTHPKRAGGTHPKIEGAYPPQKVGHKGNPSEVYPIKAAQSDAPSQMPAKASDLNSLVGRLCQTISVRCATAPTVVDVRREMETAFRGAGQFAESFHRAKTKNGWRDGAGVPLRDWRVVAKSYAAAAARRQLGVNNRK